MEQINIFSDKKIATNLIEKIRDAAIKPVTLMEVCGGHTMAIQRFGIPSILPENLRLISGPGCPVCVTGIEYVDQAVALSRVRSNIIVTYGDLIRVPGTTSTLEKEKAHGADIRVITSPLEGLRIAMENTNKRVVFLGVGFETTTPATAITVSEAKKRSVNNFFLLSAHKIMPPALRALADENVMFDGLIAPGHVSTITGSGIYEFLPEEYSLGCVICGFEPVDILLTIYMLIKQIVNNKPKVEIQYTRAVKPEGNSKARESVDEVFEKADVTWRGLGVIEKSGLVLNSDYSSFDALRNLDFEPIKTIEPVGCQCGEIMKGLKSPVECPLYSNVCTPSHPVGACMVSYEGACHAYFRYSGHRKS